jgi:hypothetical protein
MPWKLKPWQWALIAVLFPVYATLAIFAIWGNFFIGFPPWTPAFLNNTKLPLERTFRLDRKTSLRVFGEIEQGRLEIVLDGVQVAEIVGKFNHRFILKPGEHKLRLENRATIGNLNYSLE